MGVQDELYEKAIAEHGPALGRLARACEASAEDCRDLLQEIHLALWRSFKVFDGRCSIRTWAYRVAHNVAASHVLHSRRVKAKQWVSLEECEEFGNIEGDGDASPGMEHRQALERLQSLIRTLNPLDQQVILLYLEGTDAAAIGEITGISSGYVATKVHRIKAILAGRFQERSNHA